MQTWLFQVINSTIVAYSRFRDLLTEWLPVGAVVITVFPSFLLTYYMHTLHFSNYLSQWNGNKGKN